MPELTNPPVRNKQHSMEFLIGQHSLFLAGFGQSFFYLHQFKPYLPVWAATSFLLIPWAIVFILFYHDRPLLPPQSIRGWWLGSAGLCTLFTVIAEAIWALGLMPPPTPEHRIAADVLVQVLMNLAWLSFIPMIRDYRNHPNFWS
jgi:xanthine/uracil permease